MAKIFIDGSAGTTGLRIHERLASRKDLEVITLSDENRKDPVHRANALNSCDIAFLCLPDAASIEAVSMIENEDVVVIDTSTAHRTNDDWAYGFPELSASHRSNILNSKRIAVPGCHASGFISLIYPLVASGIIDSNQLLSCHSLTGYSGGGKKMIAEYEGEDRSPLLDGPRQYGIAQQHKHLKEMRAITGIEEFPLFSPIVADFYSGMEVTVPLFKKQLADGAGIEDVKKVYSELYNSNIVKYVEDSNENGFLSSAWLSGKDAMEITVHGNEDRFILVARYDNLGKGASGAAIECMNLVLGTNPETGLEL